MSIFKRSPAEHSAAPFEEAVVTEPNPDVCAPDVCLQMNPETQQLGWHETSAIETMQQAASEWAERLQDARLLSENAMDMLGETIARDRNANSDANYRDRRSSLTLESKGVANEMALMRQGTITHIQDHARERVGVHISIRDLLTSDAKANLDELVGALNTHVGEINLASSRGEGCAFVGYNGVIYPNPYTRLYLTELIGRAEIARAIITAPDAMHEVLLPEALSQAPEPFQNLVALDVRAGKHSNVLKHMARRPAANTNVFDYLVENHVTPAAREAAKYISLGAQALGGCDCPMNRAGLCKTVADAIPADKLPIAIKEDIDRKLQRTDRDNETQVLAPLRKFGDSRKISDWLSHDVVIVGREMDQVVSETRRQKQRQGQANNNATYKTLEQSIQVDHQAEITTPQEVQVSWAGSEAVMAIGMADSTKIAETIAAALESSVFTKYLRDNRHIAMDTLLTQALTTILTAPTYLEERSIVPMSHMKQYFAGPDKRRMTIYRLSGRDFKGASLKEERDLRIYFGVSHTAGTRRIDLLKVSGKGDVVKQTRRGSSLG